MSYVDDVVAGLIAALGRPLEADPAGVRHKVYNIGNSRPTPLLIFVELVERAMGRQAKRIMVPVQPGEMVSTFADIAEAERDLGFAPSTPVELGIEEFVRWFKSYHRIE